MGYYTKKQWTKKPRLGEGRLDPKKSKNIAGYWLFNEGAGRQVANAAPGGNAEISGGFAWVNDPELGRALLLDSVDGMINYGDLPDVAGTPELTVAATVRLANVTSDSSILTKASKFGTGEPLLFWQDASGGVFGTSQTYSVLIGPLRYEATSNSAVANKTQRVMFTFVGNSPTGLRMYIDGIEDANSPISTIGTATIPITTDPMQTGLGRPLNGVISDLLVVTRAYDKNDALADAHTPYANLLPRKTYLPAATVAPPATNFVSASFTVGANISLESYVGEVGAAWTAAPTYTSKLRVLASGNQLIPDATSSGSTGYYASGIPASNEYDVTAPIVYLGTSSDEVSIGIAGRMSTSSATFYMARHDRNSNAWQLYKAINNTFALLGSYSETLTTGVLYELKLEIRDGAKKLIVDGVERISSSDNSITGAGRAGVRWFLTAPGAYNARMDWFVASDVTAAGATITANQLNDGDTQSALISPINNISANQLDDGDTQLATLNTVVSLSANQLEAGDVQSAVLVGILTSSITANQLEIGDSQLAEVNVLVHLSANQLEVGDSQSAEMVGTITSTISADQLEVGDSQLADIDVFVNITSNQEEIGDTQSAQISPVIELSATQMEDGDTTSAVIATSVVSLISANQLETGDSQSAIFNVITSISANQLEDGDSQSATISVLISLSANQLEAGDVSTSIIVVEVETTLTSADIDAIVLGINNSKIAIDVDDIHKSIFNKRTWDKAGNIITLYENDGLTVFKIFNTNEDMSEIIPQ